jgi:hypothetical protein
MNEPIAPEARCPVCGSPFGDLPTIRCPTCDGPHHTECWSYAGRCATFGCNGHPASAPRKDPGKDRPPRPIPAAPPASVPVGSVAIKTALVVAAGIGIWLAVELHSIPTGTVASPSPTRAATPGTSLVPQAHLTEPLTTPLWKADLSGRPLQASVAWPPDCDGPLVFARQTTRSPRTGSGVILESREPESGKRLWSLTIAGHTGDGDFAAVATPDRVTLITKGDGTALHDRSSGALVRRYPPAHPAARIDIVTVRPGYALVGGAGLVHEIGTPGRFDPRPHRWNKEDHMSADGVTVTSRVLEGEGVLIGGGDRTAVLRQPDGAVRVVSLSRGSPVVLRGGRGDPPLAAQVKLPLVSTIGRTLTIRTRNDGRTVLMRNWPALPVRLDSGHGLVYVLRDDGGLVGLAPERGSLIFTREGVTDFQLRGQDVVVLYDDSRLERIDPATGDSLEKLLLDGCETHEPQGSGRRGPWLRVSGRHAVVIRSIAPEAHELRCFKISGG